MSRGSRPRKHGGDGVAASNPAAVRALLGGLGERRVIKRAKGETNG